MKIRDIKTITYMFVNTYLIRTDETTVLFDTGAALPPGELPEFLGRNGVDPREVQLIILSHMHWDHVQLAAEWKKLSGAKIMCHKNAVDYLTAGKLPQFVYGEEAKKMPLFMDFMNSDRVTEIEPVQPDVILGDEDFDMRPYGLPGKVIYTPGHEEASVSLLLENGIAFTGDLVVDLHTIRCLEDIFPPESYALNWICYDRQALRSSVKRAVESADFFYGGHGNPAAKEKILSLL